MKVILEGCDLAGKSTAIRLIDGQFPVQDRCMEFTNAIKPYEFDPYGVEQAIISNPDSLFVLIVMSDEDKLIHRLQKRALDGLPVDEFDRNCVLYNRRYRDIAKQFISHPRVRSFDASMMSKFQKVATIYEFYLRAKYPNEQPFSV